MVADLLDFTRSRPEPGMPVDAPVGGFRGQWGAHGDRAGCTSPAHRTLRLTVKGSCEGSVGIQQARAAMPQCHRQCNRAPPRPLRRQWSTIAIVRRISHVELAVSNEGTPVHLVSSRCCWSPSVAAPARVASSGLGLGLPHREQSLERTPGRSLPRVTRARRYFG